MEREPLDERVSNVTGSERLFSRDSSINSRTNWRGTRQTYICRHVSSIVSDASEYVPRNVSRSDARAEKLWQNKFGVITDERRVITRC